MEQRYTPSKPPAYCNLDHRSTEDPVLVKLEKELEKLKLRTSTEKNENEILQRCYDTLKKESEEQESLVSRERKEREKYDLEVIELEQSIILLKKEVSSLNNLKTSLQSQLDSRNNEFGVLVSTYKARPEQDNRKIKAMQSELKKIRFVYGSASEDHEKEPNSLSSQTRDRQHQRRSAAKKYKLPPDPRAAGFDVGKKVKYIDWRWTGTVTAVYLSGYVDVKWDNGHYYRGYAVGAEEEYHVELL